MKTPVLLFSLATLLVVCRIGCAPRPFPSAGLPKE